MSVGLKVYTKNRLDNVSPHVWVLGGGFLWGEDIFPPKDIFYHQMVQVPKNHILIQKPIATITQIPIPNYWLLGPLGLGLLKCCNPRASGSGRCCGKASVDNMSDDLNSQYPHNKPYSRPLYNPLYNPPLRSLDCSSYGEL